MAQKKKRNYMVSIWTLQDEFISVLKPYNIENKGQIEETKIQIKDDGTEEFSFSIPMYLFEEGQQILNPLWQNTQDGTIVQDMRKIKVTFNRHTEFERTFEFLIINVNESHNGDKLYCNVKCEGIAFHELGKKGYKISLTTEDFYDDDYKYFTQELNSQGAPLVPVKPRATLQYWMNKFMNQLPPQQYRDSSKWYYEVKMNWDSFEGDRDIEKIYEDSYTKSWTPENNVYVPNEVENYKEKERMVDIEESNIYNITQKLAEIFGVFCRYEYEYNENLNIIGRKIVFYNNYLNEEDGYIDLTYPYSTSAISRTRDSNDITTKMFVRPVNDENNASGLITIMDVAANKMKEDYLLNFDYLISQGNITAEQQLEIPIYEKRIGDLNNLLKSLEGPIIALQDEKIKLESSITIHTNSIQLDKERISASNDLLNQLTDNTGTITIDSNAPRTAVLIPSSKTDANGTYYINLSDAGVLPETVKIYREYNFTNRQLSNKITTGTPELDEFNNLLRISSIDKPENAKNTVYITYKYVPQLAYENVKRTWEQRLSKDEAALDNANNKLNDINDKLENLFARQAEASEQKKKCISNFEEMMGPALRESYWAPEDYKDYGDAYTDTNLYFSINQNENSIGQSGLTQTLWDNAKFDNEMENAGYNITINELLYGYPIIDLSGHEDYVAENIDKLSFMYYDFENASDPDDLSVPTPRNMKIFSVNSTAQYGWVYHNNRMKPVLIITGFDTLSEDSRNRLWDNTDNKYSHTVGVITTTITGSTQKTITTTIEAGAWVPTFLNKDSSTTGNFTPMVLYYPRIKINSLALKTSSDCLLVKYNNEVLENYKDYYVLTHDDSTWTNNEFVEGSVAYYITLKAEKLIVSNFSNKKVEINFNISNADINIYLDALKILKENSQPKVSYTIEPSVVDNEFLYSLYNRLCQICNINDTELHFKNVQGYISSLEIDCDHTDKDKIEIKNYKTKFEDLFSTIVAQTEQMQRSSYTIGLAASAFGANGTLNSQLLQNSINRADLDYSFNNGKLNIDEENGIIGTSDGGVVAFRGGGIFTATDKDQNGNWKWNTGILPQGINADLITTGQLDTNRIKVYAGDQLRFQLNGDGLFAYKSFFDDVEMMSAAGSYQEVSSVLNSNSYADIDAKQYVVHNANGLFLVAEQGAYVLNDDRNAIEALQSTVNRVEVSWDGFKLRNWDGDEVFWASPNTGDLNIKGTIYAKALYIGDGSAEETLSQYMSDYMNGFESSILGLTCTTYYCGNDDIPQSPNEGDIWYNTDNHTTSRYNGSSWENIDEETQYKALGEARGASSAASSALSAASSAISTATSAVSDANNALAAATSAASDASSALTAATSAASDASSALTIAGNKPNIFYGTRPTSGYKLNDLWIDSVNHIEYICALTSATPPVLTWIPYNKKITGTKFSVDTEDGTISLAATTSIDIASGQNLSIIGNGGVTIGSSNTITMYGGSSINLLTGSSGGSSAVIINKDGIDLQAFGGGSNPTSKVSIKSDSITMDTSGTIKLSANNAESSIIFGLTDYDAWNEWTANTQYIIGDQVKKTTNNEVIGYECIANNNDAEFNLEHWREFISQENTISISQDGLYARSGSFVDSLTLDGSNILTEEWINKRIIYSPTQPVDTDIIWLKPIFSGGGGSGGSSTSVETEVECNYTMIQSFPRYISNTTQNTPITQLMLDNNNGILFEYQTMPNGAEYYLGFTKVSGTRPTASYNNNKFYYECLLNVTASVNSNNNSTASRDVQLQLILNYDDIAANQVMLTGNKIFTAKGNADVLLTGQSSFNLSTLSGIKGKLLIKRRTYNGNKEHSDGLWLFVTINTKYSVKIKGKVIEQIQNNNEEELEEEYSSAPIQCDVFYIPYFAPVEVNLNSAEEEP